MDENDSATKNRKCRAPSICINYRAWYLLAGLGLGKVNMSKRTNEFTICIKLVKM